MTFIGRTILDNIFSAVCSPEVAIFLTFFFHTSKMHTPICADIENGMVIGPVQYDKRAWDAIFVSVFEPVAK
jgi:hypothetical protein